MSNNDQLNQQPTRKSRWTVWAELGPAWISAVTGVLVALTGAGFFVGRVTATPQPEPQPTTIITRTATVTATPAATAVASSSGSAAPTPTSGASTTQANGTLLGSYGFTLPANGSAPLGPTAPTQAQILSRTGKDVIWYTDLGGSPLSTGG